MCQRGTLWCWTKLWKNWWESESFDWAIWKIIDSLSFSCSQTKLQQILAEQNPPKGILKTAQSEFVKAKPNIAGSGDYSRSECYLKAEEKKKVTFQSFFYCNSKLNFKILSFSIVSLLKTTSLEITLKLKLKLSKKTIAPPLTTSL